MSDARRRWPDVLHRPARSALPIDGRRLLLRTLLLVLAAATGFAWSLRVDRVVAAPGVLEAVDERADVRAAIAGVIEGVHVAEGDRVRTGQVLLRLDASEARGRRERVRERLRATAERAAQLASAGAALGDALRAAPHSPVSDPGASAALERWRTARAALDEAHRIHGTLLPRERALAEARIEASRAAAEAAAATLDRREIELQGLEDLADDGLVERKAFNTARSARDAARSERERAIAGVREQRAALEVLEAQADERLAAARAQAASTAATVRDEIARIEGRLRETAGEATALRAEELAVEKELERMTVRAPVAGTVVVAETLAVGDRIEAHAPVCAITSTTLVRAVARFANRDAGRLRAGDPCRVKVDAFPYADHGIVAGRIERIALEPEVDLASGASRYPVEIALGRLAVTGPRGETRALTAGLTLRVEAVTDRPRLLALLFEPIRRLASDVAPSADDEPAAIGEDEGERDGRAEPAAGVAAGRFDARAAFADLAALAGIGPRPAGSAGLALARAHVREALCGARLAVREQPFGDDRGGEAARVNLIAHIDGSPAEVGRSGFLLVTPLATRALPSVPDFAGANEGASGAAALLECARVLARLPERPPVTFAFLDGAGDEDAEPGRRADRALVRDLAARGDLARLRAAIVVDMVGDADLRFTDERRSTPWLADALADAGARLGYADRFERGRAGVIPIVVPHAHAPLLDAGVPSALLADFDFGGRDPVRRLARNRWRQTRDDDLAHVRAESLRTTGELVLETLLAAGRR